MMVKVKSLKIVKTTKQVKTYITFNKTGMINIFKFGDDKDEISDF